MGCGCGHADTSRTQAAVCLGCPTRADGTCTASGAHVSAHVRGLPCPRGRVTPGGLVLWLGVYWRGVPYPMRLWRVAIYRDTRWLALPGCGCIDRVKSVFVRILALVR